MACYPHCVPKSQANKARRRSRDARLRELALKTEFAKLLVRVRRGEDNMLELQELLKDYISDEAEYDHNAFLSSYHDKMRVADEQSTLGVRYLSGKRDDLEVIIRETDCDLLFHELVSNKSPNHDPVVIDYDIDLYYNYGRYPVSNAEFRCRSDVHGPKYDEFEKPHVLEDLLKRLELSEECNILILGETGVGKSTFINAFSNYIRFDSLDRAMAAKGPLHYVIPTTFSYEERGGGKTSKDHVVRVGEDTADENNSSTGQSATQRCKMYEFRLGGRKLCLIDTPGIGDTRGLAQDRKNVRDILATLAPVDNLSAILFLLKPNESRMTKVFDFCMAELLSHLHRDTTRNILFGFTNCQGSGLGDTKGALAKLLDKRKTSINLGYANTFMFEAEGFRFLALYKQNNVQMTNKAICDASWTASAQETRRFLDEAMKLPAHKVKDTLQMNRTRLFITSMTKPMVQTDLAAGQSQVKLKRKKLELSDLDATEKDLEEKLTVTYMTPVRKQLDQPQTVCAHENCSKIEIDDNGNKLKTYVNPCHKGCQVKSADEITGNPPLVRCNAFRNKGDNCIVCAHEWRMHLHISYDVTFEERKRRDETITAKIKSTEDAKKAIEETIQDLDTIMKDIEAEQKSVKNALATFGVYLEKNAMVVYNDATIGYLDYLIVDARRVGDEEKVHRLQDQQQTYRTQLKHIDAAIQEGKRRVPSDGDIEEIISSLYAMEYYGKDLQEVVPMDRESLAAPKPIPPVIVSYHGIFSLAAAKRKVASSIKAGSKLMHGSHT